MHKLCNNLLCTMQCAVCTLTMHYFNMQHAMFIRTMSLCTAHYPPSTCYYQLSVFLLFRLLLLTHFGKILKLKICFPQYFRITKKYFFQVIFIFLRNKNFFRAFFLYGQRSVAEPGPTPSPWSIGLKL